MKDFLLEGIEWRRLSWMEGESALIEMGGFGIHWLSSLVFQTSTLGKMEKNGCGSCLRVKCIM